MRDLTSQEAATLAFDVAEAAKALDTAIGRLWALAPKAIFDDLNSSDDFRSDIHVTERAYRSLALRLQSEIDAGERAAA